MITVQEREEQFKKDLNRLLSSYGAEMYASECCVEVVLHKQSDLLGKEVLPECRIELI